MMVVSPDISEREAAALERQSEKRKLFNWLRREAASRDGEMAWYVARTRWGADSVIPELEAAGIEAICPMHRRWKRHPRSLKRYSVEYPLFGNHIFVRLLKAENAWVGLLTFDDIDCLLGAGERPVPLSAREVENLFREMELAPSVKVEEDTGLALGDTVLHPLGVMAELRGKVVEIDAEKREALISTVLFGRELATRCGIDDLEKLS